MSEQKNTEVGSNTEANSIKNLQNRLRTILNPDSDFTNNFFASFKEAKSKLAIDEAMKIEIQLDHIFFEVDPKFPNNYELMSNLFNKIIDDCRSQHPVVLLNVGELIKKKRELGADNTVITHEELLYSIYQSLLQTKNTKKDEKGFYPIIPCKYEPTPPGIDSFCQIIRLIDDFFNEDEANSHAKVAVIDDVELQDLQSRYFDTLMLEFAESDINRYFLAGLIHTKTFYNAINKFGSPWATKLKKVHLKELDDSDLWTTFYAIKNALLSDFDINNRVRAVIRPYGSGKTSFLNALSEELNHCDIKGVTFLNGIDDITSTNDSTNDGGSIVFVDEAVNLGFSDDKHGDRVAELLKKYNKEMIILFFPNEEALKETISNRGLTIPVFKDRSSYTIWNG